MIQGGLVLGRGKDIGSIYYGAIPPNAEEKPVLVFIHGYISKGGIWIVGNDMYSRAYFGGYRTAFVSVAPDKDMWYNGEIFSEMLTRICAHYQVPNVVVVGWSKGGVDTEAAAVHFGAYPMIKHLFSLSTPYWGTPLADFAYKRGAYRLAYFFIQVNDASYVMRTDYMKYFREITDKHENNAQLAVTSLGAWGYGAIHLATGLLLNRLGAGRKRGGNDGVVPYTSTLRPDANVLLNGYGDKRSCLNHLEIAQGRHVWGYLEPELRKLLS